MASPLQFLADYWNELSFPGYRASKARGFKPEGQVENHLPGSVENFLPGDVQNTPTVDTPENAIAQNPEIEPPPLRNKLENVIQELTVVPPSLDSPEEPPSRIAASPQIPRPIPEIEAPGEPEPMEPPRFNEEISVEAPDENPSPIEGFRALLGQRPRREDFKQGTKDKILTALVSGLTGLRDPGAGIGFALSQRDRLFREATQDYEGRLKGAKEDVQLDVLSQKPGLDVAKLNAHIETKANDLKARWAEIKQRAEAAQQTFEARMAGVKTAEEKNQITQEHNHAVEALTKEANDIRTQAVEVDRMMANAKMLGTSAYATSVFMRPGMEALKIGAKHKGLSPSMQDMARNMAVERAIAKNPDWIKHLDSKAGSPTFGRLDPSMPIPPELQKAINEEEKRIRAAAGEISVDEPEF